MRNRGKRLSPPLFRDLSIAVGPVRVNQHCLPGTGGVRRVLEALLRPGGMAPEVVQRHRRVDVDLPTALQRLSRGPGGAARADADVDLAVRLAVAVEADLQDLRGQRLGLVQASATAFCREEAPRGSCRHARRCAAGAYPGAYRSPLPRSSLRMLFLDINPRENRLAEWRSSLPCGLQVYIII